MAGLEPSRRLLVPEPGGVRAGARAGAGRLGTAHAFKFAPLLGRLLADPALHGGTDEDLGPYDPGRAILAAAASEPRYLV